jgi:hypothetical protein
MGLIYIKHGEPDIKVSALKQTVQMEDLPISIQNMFSEFQLGINLEAEFEQNFGWNNPPLNVSWKYYSTFNRGEIIFHFANFNKDIGWIIMSIPPLLEGREQLDIAYLNLESSLQSVMAARLAENMLNDMTNNQIISEKMDALQDVNTVEIPNLVEELIEKNIEYAKIGITTETSNNAFIEMPLDYNYEFAKFNRQDSTNLIECYFGIPGKQFSIRNNSQNFQINLNTILTFLSTEGKIYQFKNSIENELTNPEDNWFLVGLHPCRLPPGEYEYELHIKEQLTGLTGIRKGFLDNNYNSDSLQISDILLVSNIREKSDYEVFTKGNIAYTPRMFSTFNSSEHIGIYFEIYNLKTSQTGESDFMITYSLTEVDNNRNLFKSIWNAIWSKTNQISSTTEYKGSGTTDEIYSSFDIGSRSSGIYNFNIKVYDNTSATSIEKKLKLNIE